MFFCLVIPSYCLSTQNSYYYDSSHIFGSDTRYGKSTEKIESIFGKNDNYVLIIPKDEEKKKDN